MTTNSRTPEHPVDELFTSRWSPRAFSGEVIEPAVLMTFFEAARWAPSASNLQPWRFVFGLAGTPAWQAIRDALVPANQTWASHAAALVVVLSKRSSQPAGKPEPVPNAWHSFDAGAAWLSFALQAHKSGYATHAMGGFDPAALRAAIGAADDLAIEAVIAVGRQGDKAQLPEALQARELPNSRLPLAQLVFEGRCQPE